MQKLSLLIFILFSTTPTYAMRTLTSGLQPRGYSRMAGFNHGKFMRYKREYRLSASERAQMPKDKKDLDKLWIKLHFDTEYLEDVLDSHGEDSPDDGSPRHLYFWKPHGYLASMQGPSLGLMLVGIPLTILTAGSSVGGELVILMLNTLGASEALEIARKGVDVIEQATLYGASTTLATGTYAFLPESKLLKKYLKYFSYTNKEYQKNKAHLEHVTSLIERDGGSVPLKVTTFQTEGGLKVAKYEPRE